MILVTIWSYTISVSGESSAEDIDGAHWFSIEGRVSPPEKKSPTDWFVGAQILVNGGEHIGLLREDGTFTVQGVPSGSHVVEVIHSQFHYDSARVDITTKGKIRARKLNHLQPSQVSHLTYPLRFTPLGAYRYFQAREQWRVTDVLLSPMVLMMILPLVLIVILPKMMSDPETRREMEQVSLPKYEMPEMSEVLTSFFGGGSSNSNSKSKDEGSDRKRAIKAKKNS